MRQTTLTSKGQMTLPKAARDQLGLKVGDRLDVVVDDKRIILIPKTLHIEDITSMLPRPKRAVSVEQMNEDVRRAVARRAK